MVILPNEKTPFAEDHFEGWYFLRGSICVTRGGGSKRLMSSLIQELLNFHLRIKYTSFNVWARYFVWNFKGNLWNSTQNILPIHWKMRYLYNIEFLRLLDLRAHKWFLNAPCPLFIKLLLHYDGIWFKISICVRCDMAFIELMHSN